MFERREQDRTESTAELTEEGGEGSGESKDVETAVALQTEDEPSVAAAELNVESDEGSSDPPAAAEDVPPTDHSGDGNHRENT